MAQREDPRRYVDPDEYDAWLKRQLDAAPPLTGEQRRDIAALLARKPPARRSRERPERKTSDGGTAA
jgi:hypothetical protein